MLDHARVFEQANLYGYTTLHDDSSVYGHALVDGFTDVFDCSIIYGSAVVWGRNSILGNCQIFDQAQVCNVFVVSSKIYGHAKIIGAEPDQDSYYFRIGESNICGDAFLHGLKMNITRCIIHGQVDLSGILLLDESHFEGDVVYIGKRRIHGIHWWSNIP